MVKQVLVTGVNGFVGHHLARELHNQGHTVIGTGIDVALDPSLVPYVEEFYPKCDLTKPEHVAKIPLERIDAVINLAGLAQVGASYGDSDVQERYDRINVGVHTRIMDRLYELGRLNTRVVAVSTGAVYDNTQPMPVTENTPLAADASPYAKSKIAMEHALEKYRSMGMDVVIARPMNHIGPGQLGGFVVPDMIQKLKEMGPSKRIQMGRLDTKRDYTDVRDVVRAYHLLANAEKLQHAIYNICSGESHSGQEILDILCAEMGIGDVVVELDQSRVRPKGTDPDNIYGDASRLRKDTGWVPQIPFAQTLHDCL